MELNQKIHEWLGKCWHEDIEDGVKRCRKCGDVGYNVEWANAFPDYTTDPAAMLELLNAVRAKGYGFEADDVERFRVRFGSLAQTGVAYADTLPMAVARAVEKLIDAETTTEAKDARFKSR